MQIQVLFTCIITLLFAVSQAQAIVVTTAPTPLAPASPDHFEWSPVPGSASVYAPVPVTITAKTDLDAVETGFDGAVEIRGHYLRVLYEADFEAGLDGFAIDNTHGSGGGLWHRSTGRGLDTGHSPSNSLYYGTGEVLSGGGNYDVGDNEGVAVSPAISLVGAMAPVTLSFSYFLQTENLGGFDVCTVELSVDGGPFTNIVAAAHTASSDAYLSDPSSGWKQAQVDLSPFAGSQVGLRFHFDSVDNEFNAFEGWYVDDVLITDAVPVPVSPVGSGAFVGGVWSGLVTVYSAAYGMMLVAADGAGHTGTSAPFDVVDPGHGPATVALFFNSTFVDTSASGGGEAYNMKLALEAQGHAVNTFEGITDTAFSQALLGADVLVIPELEWGNLNSALAPAARAVISNFASSGHCVIVNADYDSNDDEFVNGVFGLAVSGTTGFYVPSSITPAAEGTVFEGGPSSIGFNDGHYPWLSASLPAGAVSIYDADATRTSVALIPQGAGQVVLLAYDWFDAVPNGTQDAGWDEVLDRAVSGCSRFDLLLISDSNELTGVAPFLDADGHRTTSISDAYFSGSPVLTNLNVLQRFDMVLWGASGSGHGVVHNAAIYATMESYVQGGGHLLVTGYDTLASPVDTALADLVRSTTTADIGQASFNTRNWDHFVLNGPAGDLRSTTVTPGYSDWDGATADASRGAVSLATFSTASYDAILHTALPSAGSVGYWTGGAPGTSATDGKTDWKVPGDSLDILRNWVFGVAAGNSVAYADLELVSSDSPDPVALWQPLVYTLVVANNSPHAALNVTLVDVLAPSVALVSATTTQGTCMDLGGAVACTLGDVPAGGSVTVQIKVVPLELGSIASQASVASTTPDPVALNNVAEETTLVVTGDDTDGDGIKDWWELQYKPGLTNMNFVTDSDGDGASDSAEWAAKTDPTNAASFFRITAIDAGPDQAIVLDWETALGPSYGVLSAPTLASPWETLATGLVYPQNSYTDLVNVADSQRAYRMKIDSEPKWVGYYDMSLGQGNASQVPSIVESGHAPTNVFDLTSSELAALDVLYVQNPGNSGYGTEYLTQLSDVENAVAAGMVLILHDRHVTGAATALPAAGAISFVSAFGGDLNVVDDTSLVTAGPGGIVDDTSLDGGTFSTHGYATLASLPAGARSFLSTGTAQNIVTFAYPYGSGWVIYSGIPLDHYLGTPVQPLAMSEVYAPNVVAFGANLAQ